jgi:DNA-binding NtrC family response regulator
LIQRLEQYDWPGNVRELENFMRRLLAMSVSPVMGVELLEETELAHADLIAAATASTRAIAPEAGMSLRDAERQLFEQTLRVARGNRTRTAQILGISVRTVRNKINEYGLKEQLA